MFILIYEFEKLQIFHFFAMQLNLIMYFDNLVGSDKSKHLNKKWNLPWLQARTIFAAIKKKNKIKKYRTCSVVQ